jgi:hypothetical protein
MPGFAFPAAPRQGGGGGMSTVAASWGPSNFPSDLSSLSTCQLLILSDECYRQLDGDHPDGGALVAYYALAEELAAREEADRGASEATSGRLLIR